MRFCPFWSNENSGGARSFPDEFRQSEPFFALRIRLKKRIHRAELPDLIMLISSIAVASLHCQGALARALPSMLKFLAGSFFAIIHGAALCSG